MPCSAAMRCKAGGGEKSANLAIRRTQIAQPHGLAKCVLFSAVRNEAKALAVMPLGIYRLEPLPAAGVVRGMVVAVCAPDDAAELGRRRGYLATGPCPHDSELLLKVVAGSRRRHYGVHAGRSYRRVHPTQ